jgi:hypothetical protein
MQPDYPLYEEMLRRGSRGRWFWRAGTWLYAGGLLGIVIVLAVWPVVFFFRFGKTSLVYPVLLLAMAGLAAVGGALRRLSYRIALGEGIDIVKFIGQPPEERN